MCVAIEIFRKYSNEKCLRNFPVIMLYLRHIVEQPIKRLYCSLLFSLKVRIRMIYIMLLILSYNEHLPRLKCSTFVNLAEISVLAPFIVFYNSTRIRPVQQYG